MGSFHVVSTSSDVLSPSFNIQGSRRTQTEGKLIPNLANKKIRILRVAIQSDETYYSFFIEHSFWPKLVDS